MGHAFLRHPPPSTSFCWLLSTSFPLFPKIIHYKLWQAIWPGGWQSPMPCPVSLLCPVHHQVRYVTSQEVADSSPHTFHMRLILFLISPHAQARCRTCQLWAQLSCVPPFRSSIYQMKKGPLIHKSSFNPRDICSVCPPKRGQRFKALALSFRPP